MARPDVPLRPCDPPLLLPKQAWRRYQREKLQEIDEALEEHDIVLVEAPTGSGKSLLAVALAKLRQGRTVITTQTIQLQQQYLETLPDDVTTIWGRANFPCALSPRLTAANAPCAHGIGCPLTRGGCAYYDAKREAVRARHARIAVLNSAYFVYEANFAKGFSGVDLLICDEGHLLESQLLGFVGTTLYRATFERLGIAVPTIGRNPLDWQLWARTVRKEVEHMRLEVKQRVEGYTEMREEIPAEVGRHAGRVNAAHRTLLDIIRLNKSRETVLVDDFGSSVRFRPVWVGRDAERVLFRHAAKTVIMSATILDPQFVAEDLLGVEPGTWAYVTIPSTFDPNRRPIFFRPVTSVGHKMSEREMDRLVEEIDRIIGAHLGKSGIIHSVSYKLRDAILQRSAYQAIMLTHGAGDRLDVLEKFKELDGRVLVSPSMGVGVDLPDDHIRFQIIPKMPFPDLGDEQVRIRKAELPKSYAWQTLAALVQAYGRGMRHEEDWADTYILDANFRFLLRGNLDMVPGWVREAIK